MRHYTSQLLQWGVWKSWAACEILSNCVCAETQSVALWVLVSLPKKAKLMQSEEAFPACLCQINQKPHKTSTLFSNYNSLLSFIRQNFSMFCKSMQMRMPILSHSGWPHFDSDSYGPLMKGEKAGYQSEGEAMWNCSVGFWKAAKRKRKCLERTARKRSVERWDGGRQRAICQTGGLAVERRKEQYGDCMFTQCSALIMVSPPITQAHEYTSLPSTVITPLYKHADMNTSERFLAQRREHSLCVLLI